jgi:hypothetical protein
MWHFMFGGVYIYAFAIVFGFKRGVWFEGSAENLLSRFGGCRINLALDFNPSSHFTGNRQESLRF